MKNYSNYKKKVSITTTAQEEKVLLVLITQRDKKGAKFFSHKEAWKGIEYS